VVEKPRVTVRSLATAARLRDLLPDRMLAAHPELYVGDPDGPAPGSPDGDLPIPSDAAVSAWLRPLSNFSRKTSRTFRIDTRSSYTPRPT
jgi:hypothetical protein